MKYPFAGIQRKAEIILRKSVQAMSFMLKEAESRISKSGKGWRMVLLNEALGFPTSTIISILSY
jgi:hypothetical protein